MKKLLTLIISAILVFPFSTAHSQTPIVIEAVEVEIWPEYDHPSVLVIERVRLDSTVSLPATVSLRIPLAVKTPYTLASREADGQLYNLEYTLSQETGWVNVNFTAPSADIQLEYYDNALTREGNDKTFQYSWLGDYEIRGGSISVQKPPTATSLIAAPDFGEPIIKQDGLTYSLRNLPDLKADEQLTIDVRYTKPDDTLTFNSEAAQQVQPSDPAALSVADQNRAWIWIVGGILLIGLVGLLLYLLFAKDRTPQKRSHRVRQSAEKKTGSIEPEAGDVFCSQCGNKAGSKDLFCRSCGAKLKR